VTSVVDRSSLPAGFGEFQIFARNEFREGWGEAVSFVKYVEIVIGGITVRLTRSLTLLANQAAIPVDLTVCFALAVSIYLCVVFIVRS